MMLFQQEKENYENEIAKLTNRLKKQGKQSAQLKQTLEDLTTTTADLEYANQQYQAELDKVQSKVVELDQQVKNASVKESEILDVSALIEEKARLADEKK